MLLGVEKSRIVLVSKDSQSLIVFEEQDDEVVQNKYATNMGIFGEVIATKKPQSVFNCNSHSAYSELVDLNTTLPILCVPLIDPISNVVLGAIQIANPKAIAMQYSLILKQIDEEALNIFMKYIASAIYNLRDLLD